MKKYDIVITVGVFDLFHKGHEELINLMYEKSFNAVVFLHDGFSTYKNKGKFPVQSLNHRYRNINHFVNRIIKVKHQDPSFMLYEFLNKNKDKKIVYVRGDDWKDFPGINIIKKHKIPIIYKKYTKGISSTLLRSKL